MKTNEMLKKEIVSYAEETAKHVFKTANGAYYFIVLSKDSEHIYVFKEDRIVKTICIEDQIKWYGQNAKCVIKHKIFLVPFLYQMPPKAVRQTKFVKAAVTEIIEKYYEAARQKTEREKQEQQERAERIAEQTRLREEQRQKEEYETYLRLKAKFETQTV